MRKEIGLWEQGGRLEKRLREVREESLRAVREGDYRKVARLTAEAARLNQALSEAGMKRE